MLKSLINYKAWADEIFYRAMFELPEVELQRQRQMLFGNILTLLNHIYAMDFVWKCHLVGVPHNFQTRNPETPTFSTLREEQKNINDWYVEYVEQLSVAEADELVNFTFIGGGNGKMRRSEIIQHVVNHCSYHRGHIEGVLYQMSIEPPTTDIPVFLREICTKDKV